MSINNCSHNSTVCPRALPRGRNPSHHHRRPLVRRWLPPRRNKLRLLRPPRLQGRGLGQPEVPWRRVRSVNDCGWLWLPVRMQRLCSFFLSCVYPAKRNRLAAGPGHTHLRVKFVRIIILFCLLIKALNSEVTALREIHGIVCTFINYLFVAEPNLARVVFWQV